MFGLVAGLISLGADPDLRPRDQPGLAHQTDAPPAVALDFP